MSRVILITSHFPYCGGEQFLETEIKYYQEIELTILPKSKSDVIRITPNNITINDYLIGSSSKKSKVVYLFKSLKNSLFYKELFSEKFLNFRKLKIFLDAMATYEMYYELFDSYLTQLENVETVTMYTYWNDVTTYALQSLKNKYNYRLVSRIHGGDLYQERKTSGYMPLKKHFPKNLDTLYTITQSANRYLTDVYGFDEDILKLSRLGVDERGIITQCSVEKSLHIVSCSFLSEVKQVHKIIQSLKIVSKQMTAVQLVWTHIGDGVLYKHLSSLAKSELMGLSNIEYHFVGNYTNEQVYEFYRKHQVDVFLNVSLSEGVPVSIMEAMSCHIPIIAPDVGGISDMIDNGKSGFLLNQVCAIEEIVEALSHIDFFKNQEVREKSYKIFLEKYDASTNYKNFIKEIIER